MNISVNQFDSLESLIQDEGLQIESLQFLPHADAFDVVLNTKVILRQRLSDYKKLAKATLMQLENYELIGNGTGIHWPDVDEDLSLKGFLKTELRNLVHNQKAA